MTDAEREAMHKKLAEKNGQSSGGGVRARTDLDVDATAGNGTVRKH